MVYTDYKSVCLIGIFGNQTQPQHPQSDREREETLTAEKNNNMTTSLAVIYWWYE